MEPIRKEDKELTAKYQKYLQKNKFLSFSLPPDVFTLYKTGDDRERESARNEIIKYGLNMVKQFVCKKYNYSSQINPVFDLDDVIQEANLLMLETIDKYDETRGEFSTYLYNVLGTCLFTRERLFNTTLTLRKHAKSKYDKILRAISNDIDDEQIMKDFSINKGELEKVKTILVEIESCELIAKKEIEGINCSPDYCVYDQETIRFIEEDSVKTRNMVILKALNELPELDKLIVVLHLGLAGNKPVSLNRIKEHYPGKSTYVYEKYRMILKKLAKNEELQAILYTVDTEYDYGMGNPKQFYLQK